VCVNDILCKLCICQHGWSVLSLQHLLQMNLHVSLHFLSLLLIFLFHVFICPLSFFLSMSCFLLLSVFTLSNLDLHSWLHVQSFPSFLVFQKYSIPSFHCCSRLHIRFLCRLRYIWHPSLQIFHFHSNSIVILYQFSPSPLLVIGTDWSSTLWRVNFVVSKFAYYLAYRFFGLFLPCGNLFKLTRWELCLSCHNNTLSVISSSIFFVLVSIA